MFRHKCVACVVSHRNWWLEKAKWLRGGWLWAIRECPVAKI